MGRPKKNLEAIDKEMNASISVEENTQKPQVGEVSISKEPPAAAVGSNEFGDEYTMEVIADNEPGADQFRIQNKDPKFEYRFLRDDKANMGVKTSNLLYLKGGWQVCPTSHLLRLGIKKEMLQPDGSYKVGELILAFMPKQLFNKKMKKDKEKREMAAKDVQNLVDGKSRINVPGVHGISEGTIKRGPLNYGTHNAVDE